MTPLDSPSCPRCFSLRVRNVEQCAKPHNTCLDCGTKSVYIPTLATISRECSLIRNGREPRDDATRKLDASRIARIQAVALTIGPRGTGRQIAAEMGVSYSSFQKIRQGALIGQGRKWCRECRAHVTALPCVLCRTRRGQYHRRRMADARQFADSPDLAKMLAWPVSALGIDVRSVNMLERAGFLFVGHLVAASDDDLLSVRNAKKVAMLQIDRALARLGFCRGQFQPTASRRNRSRAFGTKPAK